MKNHEIKIRVDVELKQSIAKAMQKISQDFNMNLTQPIFLRSAILSYCKDILSGTIKIQIERK